MLHKNSREFLSGTDYLHVGGARESFKTCVCVCLITWQLCTVFWITVRKSYSVFIFNLHFNVNFCCITVCLTLLNIMFAHCIWNGIIAEKKLLCLFGVFMYISCISLMCILHCIATEIYGGINCLYISRYRLHQ